MVFFEREYNKRKYNVRLTQLGIQAKDALKNLSFYIKNAWKELDIFNSILEKFNIGKIEIDSERI